jgi:hypothetical protein
MKSLIPLLLNYFERQKKTYAIFSYGLLLFHDDHKFRDALDMSIFSPPPKPLSAIPMELGPC